MPKITLPQLRDKIASLPASMFDYSQVLSDNQCGLVGCLAGWAATMDYKLHRPGVPVTSCHDILGDENYEEVTHDYATWFRDYFGLPREVVCALTDGSMTLSDLERFGGIALEVAKARRNADPGNYGKSKEAALAALDVVITHFPDR